MKRRARFGGLCAAVCVLAAGQALAAPPGKWSVAVERVFGITHVKVSSDAGGGSRSSSATSISLFSSFSGIRGYSTPRVALDYLDPSGLSLGGALGYEHIGGDLDQDVWVIAPRIGYFGRPSSDVGVWPRAGITHLSVSPNDNETATATAVTLEVPLVFLLGRGLSFTILPHADIGFDGGTDAVESTTTDLGLQFGVNAFF
jgi:hypothetical protein